MGLLDKIQANNKIHSKLLDLNKEELKFILAKLDRQNIKEQNLNYSIKYLQRYRIILNKILL